MVPEQRFRKHTRQSALRGTICGHVTRNGDQVRVGMCPILPDLVTTINNVTENWTSSLELKVSGIIGIMRSLYYIESEIKNWLELD